MKAACYLLFLGILSREDIQKRELTLGLLLLMGIAGVGFYLVGFLPETEGGFRSPELAGPGEELTSVQLIFGIVLGIVMILISFFSEGRIGMGDAVTMLVTGICFGGTVSLFLLWVASTLAGLYGIFLMLFFNRKKNERIPFIPFLLMAYLGWLILQ